MVQFLGIIQKQKYISMKVLKIVFLSLVLIVLFTSCKKIENRETTNIELVN